MPGKVSWNAGAIDRESCVKTGRNDLCPCGSGKKYKQCCLAAAARDEVDSPAQFVWQRMRRALEGFPPKMMRFISETYGPNAIDDAWWEFMGFPDDEEPFDPKTPHMQVFMPWFFHCWAPDPHDTVVEDESLHDRTPTSVFLEHRGRRLDPALRRYLEACAATPFSFQEIVRCDPGRGFFSHDILTGEETEVFERSASQTLTVSDVLFAQIVRVDGIAMLEACPPFGLPPAGKFAIIELRKKILPQGDLFPKELLRDWDMELRDIYLDLTQEIIERRLPRLQNTDGEALLPHRLIFGIDSAQTAFDALKHLAHNETEDDPLRSAERDESGAFTRLRFDWKKSGNRLHRSWNNTVLGSIEITPHRLVGEVNSAERAAELKKLVENALGKSARYRVTEIEPVERALAEAMAGRGADQPARPSDDDELMNLPEVRQTIREMMASHYDDWVNQKLPALGHRTPLDAVGDPESREIVEALVRQLERDGPRMKPALDAEIVDRLRSRLGLAPAGSSQPSK